MDVWMSESISGSEAVEICSVVLLVMLDLDSVMMLREHSTKRRTQPYIYLLISDQLMAEDAVHIL